MGVTKSSAPSLAACVARHASIMSAWGCVPDIHAEPNHQLNLETRNLQSPLPAWDGETPRSPGAPAWDPEDKEDPQLPGSTQGSRLVTSLGTVTQASGNADATALCTVLIRHGLYPCFKILSLITLSHLFFHVQSIGQMKLT